MSPCHFFHREFLSLDIERQSVCKTVVRFLTMSDLIFFNFEDCVPYLELYFEIFTISAGNYIKLLKERDIEKYLSFYDQNYF